MFSFFIIGAQISGCLIAFYLSQLSNDQVTCLRRLRFHLTPIFPSAENKPYKVTEIRRRAIGEKPIPLQEIHEVLSGKFVGFFLFCKRILQTFFRHLNPGGLQPDEIA